MLILRAQADNQTSSRLFRTAKPEVRLPATSAAPLTIEVNPSPAVSGPTAIPPHLRDLPRYSATHDVRPDVKREDPTNHAQASGSGTAASTVESDQDSPPSATSCYGDSKYTQSSIISILHPLILIDILEPCLASTVPMTVSAVKEGHALIQDEQLQHTLPNVGSLSLSTLQETDDVCPICEGPYTHDDPGLSTPCCGLLIHQLCNFEAFEEHGECHGCHGDQVAADMPEPESPSATDDYIRHFDTKPQSFSTSSLKSEQVGASSTSTSSAIMTLSEYVESQAEPRSATSSLAADASSASFSWVSSVEDGDIDKDDTSLSEEPTGTFTTTPDSLQARVASASKEETQSMPFEAWNHTQPCSSNLPSDQPTTAEAMEILDGATEHLIDAYLEFGMCVDNEFKDGILERIVIAFEGKVDQPW